MMKKQTNNDNLKALIIQLLNTVVEENATIQFKEENNLFTLYHDADGRLSKLRYFSYAMELNPKKTQLYEGIYTFRRHGSVNTVLCVLDIKKIDKTSKISITVDYNTYEIRINTLVLNFKL